MLWLMFKFIYQIVELPLITKRLSYYEVVEAMHVKLTQHLACYTNKEVKKRRESGYRNRYHSIEHCKHASQVS